MDRTKQRQERRRSAFQMIRERFPTGAALAEALGEGFSPSYVSQLLSGHRGIGDEVADKIEARLKMEQGQLDTMACEKQATSPEIVSLVRTIEVLTESGKMSPDEIRAMNEMLKARR